MAGEVPKLPKGITVSDRVVDFYDDLAVQADAYPDGPERDEVVAAIAALVERVKAEVTPDVPGNPLLSREFTDRRGRLVREETDDLGHVRRRVVPKDETDALKAVVELRTTEREEIRAGFAEVDKLRQAAALAPSEGEAEKYRARADELTESTRGRLERLTASIPPDELRSYELDAVEPVAPSVQKALDLLHDGNQGQVYEALRAFDQSELYQFMKKVPPEDEKYIDALMRTASDEIESRTAPSIGLGGA